MATAFAEDSEDDGLYLEALEDYEKSVMEEEVSRSSENCVVVDRLKPRRFAEPVTEADILNKIQDAIPATTRKTTAWALSLWMEWRDARSKSSRDNVPPLLDAVTNEELNHWLARFIVEVRNRNGERYPGTTLYSICAGIQRYIREKRAVSSSQNSLDIYKLPEFSYFRSVFDSILKELHQQGIGNTKKQAQVITVEVEERMWSNDILGDDTPEKLLNTLIYCLGLNLALRSGKEHRSLRPDMFQIVQEKPAYLLYTESGSKNNSGGLRDRKLKNKVVKIFENEEKPERCVLKLFIKYMSLRPPNATTQALYLQPLQNPSDNCWYANKAVGHNPLSNTVKKLIKMTGEDGYFTNHSLRRTCATRLYSKGIDEQQIMSVTGHRSTDAVRLYKEISDEQKRHMSQVLQLQNEEDICERE